MSVTFSGGGLTWDANINMANFQAQINAIEQQIRGLTVSSQKEANAIENLVKKAAGAMAAYTSFSTASNFINDVIRVRGEFQSLSTAFEVMLGSKEKADKLMQEAVQLAQTTPFELQDVAGAAKQLLAYGTAADNITGTIKMLGNVASGVGAPLNEIIYLYGTLQTQGKAQLKDIQQFAGRGIPIIDELAKQFGVAKDQVTDLVSAGKIGFPQVEKAFQAMTGQGGMFFNLMERQSKNLNGQIANMKDAWSRFQNELGKSSEGVLSGGIALITSLIDHYEEVLKVLGVLITTYGSYRAALIANTVTVKVYDSTTKSLAISQTLQATATSIASKAMALLNRTMMANPAALVTAGVAALVSAMIIFRDKTIEVKTAQDLLADAQKNMSDRLAETRGKIEPYLEALNKANVSEADRVNIYNKLKEIDPLIVQGLNAKTIGYKNLRDNVDKYLDSLRNQLRLEANRGAATESIKQEHAFEDKIAELRDKQRQAEARYDKIKNDAAAGAARIGISSNIQRLQTDIDRYERLLKRQQEITRKFGKASLPEAPKGVVTDPNAGKTNKQIIDEKASLEDLAAFRKTLEENYQKESNDLKRKALADDLKYADARKKLLDVYGGAKESAKQLQKEEKGINSLLEERRGIIESLQALQRDAKQSGLSRDLSEIDRLNEKYDLAIQKVTDFNTKVSNYNRRHGTSAQGIGADQIAALQQARTTEISNAESKAAADRYIKSLEDQQAIFERFAEAQKNFGIEKAEEMYKEQTKGFESYLEFLNSEAAKLAPVIALGLGDVGDEKRFAAILKEIADTKKKIADQEVQDMARLFQDTATFNQKKSLLEKQNQKDLALLRKKFQGEDLAAHERNLKIKYDKEEAALLESFRPQTELYKRLNESILGFSKKRIRDEIKFLKETLKSGVFADADGKLKAISPEQKKQIEDQVKKLEDFAATTGKVFGASVEQLNEMAKQAREIAGVFSSLADAVAPLNAELGGVLSQLSDMAGIAGNALAGMGSFASGDYLGAAQSAANVVGSIVKIFTDAKKSADDAKKAIADFYQAILFGEIQTAQAARERMVLEAGLNKQRLAALAAQKKALEENRKASQEQFTALMQQLQQEQYIVDQKTKKGPGTGAFGLIGMVLGLGAKTDVKQELQSLAGMTFAQIEELFNKGQLTDKAKELFQQLQKLKQEGVDIDRQLQELQEQANRIFTGTTADSIASSIREGLKDGKRSVADFADDLNSLLSNAILSAFEAQTIGPAMQQFYDQLAAFNSDAMLTPSELSQLQTLYNTKMDEIIKKFEQVKQISGFNVGGIAAGKGNTMAGAIKGITADQANILSGQFSGLRMTAADQLNVARRSLEVHQKIEFNTAATVQKLTEMMARIEHYYRDYGIKIR